MTFKDITPENKLYIVKCIETALRRLCINTRVKMDADKDDEPIFKSADIQTTPALFKSVRVEGGGEIRATENPNIFVLYLGASYKYEQFNGGTNGAEIGTLQFIISNNGKWQDVNFNSFTMRFYVEHDDII